MRKRGKQRWRTGVRRWRCCCCALRFFAASGAARRDPLNPLEIDQLRDAMLDPDDALKALREVFPRSHD